MYDLSIIGGGWAGFSAAIKAKKLGLNLCLIEDKDVGGTCLNRGCIPTKTLIQSAKVFSVIKKSSNFGINLETIPKIDFAKIQERKNNVIKQLRDAMQSRLGGINFINSRAEILSGNQIKISNKIIDTKNIIIATGSSPVELDCLRFGGNILSSDDILNINDIPASLLIVGGGVIGCEFASLFSILGSQVSVVEKMSQLLPGEDKEIARKIENIFKKKKIKVFLNSDIAAIDLTGYDKILVCVGRKPNTLGLGLENIGIKSDVKASIITDGYLNTSLDNVYAVGDCTSKIMLAHFASYQAEVAVDNCVLPKSVKADNNCIPNTIFTDPEIASVGMNEEKALIYGIDFIVNKFDFLGSGMARIMDEADGFIKIISGKKDGLILGACAIGPRATELIAVLALAVSSKMRTHDLKRTIFSHPSITETIPEALKSTL